MRNDDVAVAAITHLDAFPGFFLSGFGAPALRELYRGFLSDPSAISLVADRQGEVVALVAGTTVPAGFYGRMFRTRWWRFAFAGLARYLRHPVLLWRVAWRLAVRHDASPGIREAVLMSIAVAPSHQHQGVGGELIRAFLAEAKARGSDHVSLATDADNNERASRFYERSGFRLRRVFTTRENRRMHEYVVDL